MILFLADFSVIRPEPGLLIWTTLIFLLFWGMMGKFAFKPIQNALKEREQDIQHSLDAAKKAKEEITSLQSHNENLLKQAAEERAAILKEAKEIKDKMINDAKTEASAQAAKIIADANASIHHQKMAALTDIKNQVGSMVVEISEKILRKELSDKANQEKYITQLADGIKLN